MNPLDFKIIEVYEHEVDFEMGVLPCEYQITVDDQLLTRYDARVYGESCPQICEAFVSGYVAATDQTYDVTHLTKILKEEEDERYYYEN